MQIISSYEKIELLNVFGHWSITLFQVLQSLKQLLHVIGRKEGLKTEASLAYPMIEILVYLGLAF